MSVTKLDATPENSNEEECEVCKAEPSMPCVYSTNPPTPRDRMHCLRVEAAQRKRARVSEQVAEGARKRYQSRVAQVAKDLRSLADRIEREATAVRHFGATEESYGDAATTALNSLCWAIPNLRMDRVVSDGYEIDRYAREAGK